MMRRGLTVLCIGFMCIFVAGCGQSYELQSISVSPTSPNLQGIGSTQQLTVTAHYSNTKSLDVTSRSNYELGASALAPAGEPNIGPAPLDAVTLSTTGLLQAVVSPTTGFGSCTWVTEPTNPPTDTTFSYGTVPYPLTITYTEHGVTATTYAYVSAAVPAGCYDPSNPAPPGFPGD
jgi:hypothetical protein